MLNNSNQNINNRDIDMPIECTSQGGSSDISDDSENELFKDQGSMSARLDRIESLSGDNPNQILLVINQFYQSAIIHHLNYFEERLERRRQILGRLEESKILEKSPIFLKYGSFTSPYFRDHFGSCPKPNQDSITKKMNNESDAYTQPSKLWRLKEKKNLIIGVRDYTRRQLLQPHFNKKDFLFSKMKGSFTEEETMALISQYQAVANDIEKIRETPHTQIIGPIGSKLDWMAIANNHMKGSRSPEECELMWNNFLHPSINKKPWTKEEDSKIIALSKETKGREWEYIASQLGTNRTAFQCIQRYHKFLKRVNYMGPWHPDEDELLKKVVMSYSKYNRIPWHLVSHYMEGRSANQIKGRWYETLNPNRMVGKWSPKEDMLLMAAVKKFGTNDWKRISLYIPGRSNNQCRERYQHSLNIQRGRYWTKEEDLKLMKLVKMHSGEKKWTSFTIHFPGRTDNQLLQRYTRIIRRHPGLELASLEELPDNPEDLPECPTRQSSLKSQANSSLRLWGQIEDTLKQTDTDDQAMESLPPSLDRLLVIRRRLLAQDRSNDLVKKELTDSEEEEEEEVEVERVDQELQQLFTHWNQSRFNSRTIFLDRSKRINDAYNYLKKQMMEALWVEPPSEDEEELEEDVRMVQFALSPLKGSHPPLIAPCPSTVRALNLLSLTMPKDVEQTLPILEGLPSGPLPSQLQGCLSCKNINWTLHQPIATECPKCNHHLEVKRQFYLLEMRLIAVFLMPSLLLDFPPSISIHKLPHHNNAQATPEKKAANKEPIGEQIPSTVCSPKPSLKRQRSSDALSKLAKAARNKPQTLLEKEEDEQPLVCNRPRHTYTRRVKSTPTHP